jgi:hypothetical protein
VSELVLMVLYLRVLPPELLFVTQEKSFDLGSTDPRGSPTAVNLCLETEVFQLRKHA